MTSHCQSSCNEKVEDMLDVLNAVVEHIQRKCAGTRL